MSPLMQYFLIDNFDGVDIGNEVVYDVDNNNHDFDLNVNDLNVMYSVFLVVIQDIVHVTSHVMMFIDDNVLND
jgi:hypothetical protein